MGSGKGLCWVPECKEVQHIAAICPWCQSRWRLARGLVCQPGGQPGVCFAILAANPETRTEEPRWDSKTGGDIGNRHGHWKPARRSGFRRNPLNCCLGNCAENPGNRRAICLLEPLIPTPWGSSGSPEWGSWSQYQKDSGADRQSVISGHLGGWPMEGVFFSYGVCPSDSDSPDRVVPRNFTAGSGSNVCNNFPTVDRPPHTPPGCYCK